VRSLFLVLAIVVIIVGAYFYFQPKPTYALATIEVVATPSAREQGLSGRTELAPDYGMLFVFPEDGDYAFWMKDMLVPIDIIWVTEMGTIAGIEHSVSPDTYPTAFHPPYPVRYVLETRAGVAQEKGWSVGTELSLPIPR